MNPMTDEELDRDWKPNGRRPQSTIARSFSQELMDIFRIENSVADLDEQVVKRKQNINKEKSELEALEARIREMEQRLKKNPAVDGTTQQQPTRPPVAGAFGQEDSQGAAPSLPEKDQARPGTARQQNQAVPGALPPTPVASEGEYELVHAPSTDRQHHHHHHHHNHFAASVNSSSHSLHRSSPRESESQTLNESLHLRPHGVGATGGEDARSVKSERSFADYVVVPAQDGDGEQDA